MRTYRTRNPRGNMIILITAIIVGVVIALVLFSTSFVRIMGTSGEQQTAIEAAAAAAARDLSRIVVETPECGFVSLSDFAPVGTYTQAADGYALPVKSINTLIGTARVDMIIADKLGQQVMIDLSKQDLQNALTAKDTLVAALKASLTKTGFGYDKDGNQVRPYASAEDAYTRNHIRMSGGSTYIADSLKLELGCLEGGAATGIPLPNPQSKAAVTSSQRAGDFYKSYVNIPYLDTNFVFGGIGSSIKIVDRKAWRTTIPGLAYQFPTIVRAEATQNIKDLHSATGYNTQAVACAQPATVHDPLPAPGALSISFPDGRVPEIQRPEDCYLNANLSAAEEDPMDLLTSKNGDYPIDGGSHMQNKTWPLDDSNSMRPTGDVWKVGLHDWFRRAATKANIDSCVNMQKQMLDMPSPSTVTWLAPISMGGPYLNLGKIPGGIIHIFKFNPDGTVHYRSKQLTPYPLYCASHEQMYGESMIAIRNSAIGTQTIVVNNKGPNPPDDTVVLTKTWDAYIRDEVRNPGRIKGGKHAGEPLNKPVVAFGGKKKEQNNIAYTTYGAGSGAVGHGHGHGHGKGKGKGATGPTGNGDKGWPPLIAPQSDFGELSNPPATVVNPMPSGSGKRPFYESTGTAVDIRFRRQVDVTDVVLGPPSASGETGYIGIVGP